MKLSEMTLDMFADSIPFPITMEVRCDEGESFVVAKLPLSVADAPAFAESLKVFLKKWDQRLEARQKRKAEEGEE